MSDGDGQLAHVGVPSVSWFGADSGVKALCAALRASDHRRQTIKGDATADADHLGRQVSRMPTGAGKANKQAAVQDLADCWQPVILPIKHGAAPSPVVVIKLAKRKRDDHRNEQHAKRKQDDKVLAGFRDVRHGRFVSGASGSTRRKRPLALLIEPGPPASSQYGSRGLGPARLSGQNQFGQELSNRMPES